ncbi:MAG: type II toxin-antitoxin system RelE/ParE family toxin [Planctomycetaceae bacterium]
MNFRVRSPVHREIVRSASYLEKHGGLGADFLQLVYSSLDAIEADPERFPLWEANPLDIEIRRVILKRFQYLIYYQIVVDEIIVLSVCHGSRHYSTWLDRVQVRDFWPETKHEDQPSGDES